MKNRIVITGLGVVSSIGTGKDAFWENLLKGVSGISELSAFDTSGHKARIGGEVKNFDATSFISKRRSRFMGRASQLVCAATRLAFDDAGITRDYIESHIAGVCLGTTMGEIQSVENADHNWIRSGLDDVLNLSLQQSPPHNMPSNVAIEFKLRGRNRIFTTACAAGNYAIGYAADLLRSGDADLMIAGGADAISWIAFTGFDKVGAIASEKCQPFDKNRRGMIPGEGAGILILERLDDALKRSARVYAEVLGYGLSCDANHMTNPNVDGVARCMRNALGECALNPEDIDYISAHGTGTVHNDRTECAAIKSVFGDKTPPVSSIKSMLGHTMGAASAIEAITCSLAVYNDIIPPTINYETPDPECAIDCVPNTARESRVNIALNNGFAFGGNNACLVIKKFK